MTFARGQRLRVLRSRDGGVMLQSEDGPADKYLVTVAPGLHSRSTVTAGDRKWRLKHDGRGWEAAGEPAAELHRRRLRSDLLTIGGRQRYRIRLGAVDDDEGREILRIEEDSSGAQLERTLELHRDTPEHVVALALAALRFPPVKGGKSFAGGSGGGGQATGGSYGGSGDWSDGGGHP